MLQYIPALALYQIIALLVILLGSILFVCIKLKIYRFSFNGLFRGIDRKDILLMSLITIPYIALSFVHYGDRFKQGHWFGDIESKTLTIQLNKPVPIKQLHYYIGLASGALEVSAETESGYKFIVGKTDTDVRNSPPIVFRWISFNFAESKPVKNIYIKITKPIVEIKQLAIIDGNYNYLNDADFSLVSFPFDKRDYYQNFVSQELPTHVGANDLWLTMAISDEAYYATSAFQLFNHVPPYVLVHPHFGMLLIGLGILLFGMNPFGWRFIPLLSGILMLPLVYFLAKKISNSRAIAFLSSFLLSIDFMHFSISRLAFIDDIVSLFIFIEYIFLWQYLCSCRNNEKWQIRLTYLFFCGIFFSFAFATKWSALFSLIAIITLIIYYELLIFRRQTLFIRIVLVLLSFIVIPFGFYCLTFIPEYLTVLDKNYLQHLLLYHQQMIVYHTKTALTLHSDYVSKWWTWPLNLKPFPTYWYLPMGRVSTALLMGNPAIWWFSILCFFIMLSKGWEDFKHKKYNQCISIFFVIGILLCQYLPYALFKRGSFIYYLYTVTPFMCLIVAYALYHLWQEDSRIGRSFVIFYLALAIGLFIAFYPILAGVECNLNYVVKYLLWYKSWKVS